MTSGRLVTGEVPGLKSVASATGTPTSISSRAGSRSARPRNQGTVGSRTATTGRPAAAASARAAMPAAGRRPEMVRRERAELRGQLRPARRRQLIGVEADGKAEGACGEEDPPRLVGREDALLAEDVARARDALRGDGRQLLPDDRGHVRLGRRGRVHGVGRTGLRRDGMGPEERRHHVDRPLLAKPAGDRQQAELRRGVEAVARLCLDRRGAGPEHLCQPPPTVRHQ